MADILLVEDQQNPRKAFSFLLKTKGYTVEEAEDGRNAINKLKSQLFDLVITDLKMEPIDGMQVLRETKKYQPKTEVIVITAYGTVDSGVKAMKLGAFYYITKPFDNDEFLILVKRALEKRRALEENEHLKQALDERNNFTNIIGKSDLMKQIQEIVTQVARTESTIIIYGESGTGKELIAQAIHQKSLRKAKPMITINCGSLPENLLDSELFGHVKGSFTGAISDKKGLFQEADRGTLFLDEVGEISPQTQVRLLRCLQEGEIRRVGDNHASTVDVRLLAATNRNLEDEVEKGRFREDLYYRLNVIPIHLPPLRKRKDDIPLLANYFMQKYTKKLKKEPPAISPAALSLLLDYKWPGNVRELENVIERIVTLNNKKTIETEDISFIFPKGDDNLIRTVNRKKTMTLAEIEKWLILETLQKCSGNQKLTAQELDISTTTLWRKLKAYDIRVNK